MIAVILISLYASIFSPSGIEVMRTDRFAVPEYEMELQEEVEVERVLVTMRSYKRAGRIGENGGQSEERGDGEKKGELLQTGSNASTGKGIGRRRVIIKKDHTKQLIQKRSLYGRVIDYGVKDYHSIRQGYAGERKAGGQERVEIESQGEVSGDRSRKERENIPCIRTIKEKKKAEGSPALNGKTPTASLERICFSKSTYIHSSNYFIKSSLSREPSPNRGLADKVMYGHRATGRGK